MSKRILITGGSVAANTLAFWLVEGGFEVTVVEKAPEFRDGGQNVDVRGVARRVLARMGVEGEVAKGGTGETGWTFVNDKGEPVAKFELKNMGVDGPTAELEVLRGDLARILYTRVASHVDYRFGDSIASLLDGGNQVHVRFESGREEDYDLLLIAEGVGSSTRELVFAGENEPRWMDVTMGYFTIPKGERDGSDALWYNAPGGRSVFLRPDNKGGTRAVLTLQHEQHSVPDLTVDEQKAWLKKTFANAGWETPRVLAGLDNSDDLYFDVLRQVRMGRWSKGRVALTGDAAWCATPLSGIGTTLSIVGAYVLAGELARTADPADAFQHYDNIMRPFVEKGQGGNGKKIAARLNHPQSRIGIAIQRSLLGVAAAPGIRDVMSKFAMPPAEQFELPEYSFQGIRGR